MTLFQPSVLKHHLELQTSANIESHYSKYKKYFHDAKIQENIRASKEEEYQGIFLTELFGKILGYTMKPNANFNLVAEYKNEKNSRKADGAILKDDQAIAVIELKGTKTKELEKIRQQAFDYKANQSACVYVITSNFEKLRFYIENAVDHIEFDLFTLTKDEFKLLYLCLAKDNILSDLPKRIKDESLRQEKQVTDKLYADYSLFKRELYRDLVKSNMKNEVFRSELNSLDDEQAKKNIKLTLFKKSQKLIDRLLFIFFAEDRGLLAPNSTVKILQEWNQLKDLDVCIPLYERFKQYFNYLDTGRKGTDKQDEIYAYNGGLFKPDPILDSLIISDDLLYSHSNTLSEYDFASQVDVNILGHIFENSLNEIESVNAEIQGVDFDKKTTKRKKDGVFYTPKYITKYIVDNTVGKLCTEKKVEHGVIEAEYLKSKKGRPQSKIEELYNNVENYRNWLLTITICDPACGSGAFLNQALDFLIKEHNYLDGLISSLTGTPLVLSNIETTILENNIYGVDLNEESVEIAKLSLWLRTAQPRRKLNNLNSNIKCGNSLIDSKAVVGDKAFNWHEQYPDIFAKGGFDVVIGNPPYVFSRDNISKELKDYYVNNYVSAEYQVNTYLLFIEQTIKIIKDIANYGLIIPNAWLMVGSATGLRNYILQNCSINEIINLAGYSFEGVNVETIIILATKTKHKQKNNSIKVLLSDDKEFRYSHSRNQIDFEKNEGFEFKVFSDQTSVALTKKLKTTLKT